MRSKLISLPPEVIGRIISSNYILFHPLVADSGAKIFSNFQLDLISRQFTDILKVAVWAREKRLKVTLTESWIATNFGNVNELKISKHDLPIAAASFVRRMVHLQEIVLRSND